LHGQKQILNVLLVLCNEQTSNYIKDLSCLALKQLSSSHLNGSVDEHPAVQRNALPVQVIRTVKDDVDKMASILDKALRVCEQFCLLDNLCRIINRIQSNADVLDADFVYSGQQLRNFASQLFYRVHMILALLAFLFFDMLHKVFKFNPWLVMSFSLRQHHRRNWSL